MNIKELYAKYRSVIAYLFFGVCTTLVNVITYWCMVHVFKYNVMTSTIISWIFAILFAYSTNRKWVFKSQATSYKDIIMEMVSFFGCRFATGLVDWICMLVFVNFLAFNDVIIKFFANVIVIILNYIASKMIIFTKKIRKVYKKDRINCNEV